MAWSNLNKTFESVMPVLEWTQPVSTMYFLASQYTAAYTLSKNWEHVLESRVSSSYTVVVRVGVQFPDL